MKLLKNNGFNNDTYIESLKLIKSSEASKDIQPEYIGYLDLVKPIYNKLNKQHGVETVQVTSEFLNLYFLNLRLRRERGSKSPQRTFFQ